MICHKPSSSVLITPDGRDFFYTCAGHLADRGFATAVVDREEEERARRKEELDRAVEEVKREWEEKLKKRKKAAKDKDKEKDKDKGEGKEDDGKEKEKTEEKEKDEKIKKLETDAAPKSAAGEGDGPRIFNLHKYVGPVSWSCVGLMRRVFRSVYQMRVNRIQAAQRAKRDAERLRNPTSFPAVPSGLP